MGRARLLLLLVVGASRLFAASLPTGLSSTEIDHLVEVIGAGSTVRLLRSAEPYELFPGLKLGMEVAIVPTRDLNNMGNQDGSLPVAIPVPRFYFAKGLFFNLELILNLFPVSIASSLSTFGGSLKWAFFDESANWLHGAIFLTFTNISGFDRAFTGNNIEMGGVISKDYVRLKPYLGGGLLFARGNISPAYAKTAETGGAHSTLHLFVGGEVELPLSLGFQLDLFNLSPAGTLFFGKKF